VRDSLLGEPPYDSNRRGSGSTKEEPKGADAWIMEGLGHFPMSQNPARFREYILPVLEKLRAAKPR
jgi:hypothetical protein